MNTRKAHSRHRQRGVVILVLILIVMSASSYVVLKALNENSARDARQRFESTRALDEAKRALIGYAVAYADGTHALGKGPGHLPCPDHSAAGTPGSSDAVPDCTLASSNETGRFPWRTLGLRELLDGSGAPLWYAVSDNFRSTANPPLNSDTPGTLSVDGLGDVVAVIIAPGGPLATQSRTAANRYDAGTYLENANASTGDGAFVTVAAGDFNDVVVTITRRELMAPVEKTVITEVANALDNYFSDPDGDDAGGADPDCGGDPDCDDGYPWLSDFADPTTSAYLSTVDNFAGGDVPFGHVPLVRSGIAFNADFSAAWDVATAGALTGSGVEPPDDACVRDNACTQLVAVLVVLGVPVLTVPYTFPAVVSGAAGGQWSQGTCVLMGATNVTCTATFDFSVTFLTLTRDMRRVYQMTFAGNTRFQAPTTASARQLGVTESGSWSGSPATLTVTDFEMPGATQVGTKTLAFSSLDAGDDVSLAGVPFELEISNDAVVDHSVSPGELPNWFFQNNWHQHVVVQYATAESPGNAALTCAADASCLTVNIARPGAAPVADVGVRGIVMAPGEWLPAVNNDARPTAERDDYFEGNNVSENVVFDVQQASNTFNDRLVTLPLQRP